MEIQNWAYITIVALRKGKEATQFNNFVAACHSTSTKVRDDWIGDEVPQLDTFGRRAARSGKNRYIVAHLRTGSFATRFRGAAELGYEVTRSGDLSPNWTLRVWKF